MNQLLLNRVVIAVHRNIPRVHMEVPAIFDQALCGQEFGHDPVVLVLPHTQHILFLKAAAKECLNDPKVVGVQWPVKKVVDLEFWSSLVEAAKMVSKKDIFMLLLDEERAHAVMDFLVAHHRAPQCRLLPDFALQLKLRPTKKPYRNLIEIVRDKPIESATEKPAAE